MLTASQSDLPRVEPSSAQNGQHPRPCIVLVNDDEDSLFFLGRSVRKAIPEAELVLMNRSVEALSYIQSHPVTAVVTDNRMPEMDGLTLVRRIRERDARVPILMVTGSMDAALAAADAGVNGYLSRLCWAGVGAELRNLLWVQ